MPWNLSSLWKANPGQRSPGTGFGWLLGSRPPKNLISQLPLDVSPIFYKLRAYVEERFQNSTKPVRYTIFALAYTMYCEAKKNQISYHLKHPPNNTNIADVIAIAFKEFDDHAPFAFFSNHAKEIWEATLDDEINAIIKSAIKKNTPGLGKEFIKHLGTGIVVAIMFWVFPAVLVALGSKSAAHWLHNLGVWLTSTYPGQ